VRAADRQDRDGAPKLLRLIRHAYPWLRHIFADGSYAGPKLKGVWETIGCWTLEIVKRSDLACGFKVLPRRWVIERTFAWATRFRRLVKDYERLPQTFVDPHVVALACVMLKQALTYAAAVHNSL
jgi:putative transposase